MTTDETYAVAAEAAAAEIDFAEFAEFVKQARGRLVAAKLATNPDTVNALLGPFYAPDVETFLQRDGQLVALILDLFAIVRELSGEAFPHKYDFLIRRAEQEIGAIADMLPESAPTAALEDRLTAPNCWLCAGTGVDPISRQTCPACKGDGAFHPESREPEAPAAVAEPEPEPVAALPVTPSADALCGACRHRFDAHRRGDCVGSEDCWCTIAEFASGEAAEVFADAVPEVYADEPAGTPVAEIEQAAAAVGEAEEEEIWSD